MASLSACQGFFPAEVSNLLRVRYQMMHIEQVRCVEIVHGICSDFPTIHLMRPGTHLRRLGRI